MAWRFTKIKEVIFKKYTSCDPILTCHKEMNECMEKYLSIHGFSAFMGHAFWKENIEDRVKLLESII